MKTAIVLTPESNEELAKKLEVLVPALDGADYEIIAVLNTYDVEKLYVKGLATNVRFIEVGDLLEVKKRCMARYLISDDVEYLYFAGMDEVLTKEELERKVGIINAEPNLIGAVGTKVDVTDDYAVKSIFHKLLSLVNIDKEEFDKRCRDEQGDLRSICTDDLITSVRVFDSVGGFNVKSEDAYLEYGLRIQCLGLTILPLTK